MSKGRVDLIGAGPGDPGLLTLKGRDILAKADVVVYDALVNPQLLRWARPGAIKIYVGKRGGQHAKEQREINTLLVRQARRGRRVARLKGGDPFLFGRGGEEAASLAEKNIPFEVVPGVTSASGVAASAGIPLTDRRLSSMVTLVTGHESQGKEAVPVDWGRLPREGTLVIFMGLEQLGAITDRLIHYMWDKETPAAAIRWGSRPEQEVVEGTLADIAARVRKAKLESPVLVIIGKVVALRKKLRWREKLPLYGRTILITRPAGQASEFTQTLEELGARVISLPTIQIIPPKSWQPVDKAIREIGRYDWILFTSVNGVSMFFARLAALGMDIRDLKGARLGAIGPKTSARLEALGLKVDAFPEEYRAEALADVIGRVKGCRVLLARAERARDILPKTLAARGASVTVATVYRTLAPRGIASELRRDILSGCIDAVTFTSSSTVDGFLQHFSKRDVRRIFARTRAAAIGPITAATLRERGVRPAIRAKHYTTEALVQAIVQYFS